MWLRLCGFGRLVFLLNVVLQIERSRAQSSVWNIYAAYFLEKVILLYFMGKNGYSVSSLSISSVHKKDSET